VAEADWVVFGPGSWFTSVLPHLLVPDLAKALVTTTARRLVVLNLVPQPGETSGFSPETHLEVLATHAPDLRIDVVLADQSAVTDVAQLHETTKACGAELIVAPVTAAAQASVHHPKRLASAYARIMCPDAPDLGADRWR
jgi:uncharacterized cofD-like protein